MGNDLADSVQARGEDRASSIESFVSQFDFFIPYESKVSQEVHSERGRRVYRWLLGRSIVSSSQLAEINKRRLTQDEFRAIDLTPHDYWLIATAKGMDEQQHEAFVSLLGNEHFDYSDYIKQQNVWIWTALFNYRNSNSEWPSTAIENNLILAINGEFRVYYVLKRDVFGEAVSYQHADESWKNLRQMRQEKYERLIKQQGAVTEWALELA